MIYPIVTNTLQFFQHVVVLKKLAGTVLQLGTLQKSLWLTRDGIHIRLG